MISVMHVTTGLDLGGAETLLADLVTRSAESRHHVVSLLPGGAVRPRLEAAGIPVIDLGMRHARPSLTALLQLRRIIHDTNPAVVHAWMYHACVAAALADLGRRPGRGTKGGRGRPLLWGLHAANLDLSKYHITTTLVTSACRWLSTRPRAIVVNSKVTEDYHRRLGYKPKHWALIPNGIDTDHFRPDPARRQAVRATLGIPQHVPLIGFIARRDPQKDHVTFLRAASRLSEPMPGAQFLLAGLGTDDPLMHDLVRRYAPSAAIHLLGARDDVAAITTALDVATMCSFGESFSNAVAEAMACGTPCVVSRVPPLPEILDGTGAVVENGNADALAAAWASLLAEGPQQRQARAAAARNRICTEFSATRMVARFEALYRDIANGN